MTVACFKFSNPVRSQRQKLSKRPIRQQRRCSKILFSVSCHRYCVKIDVVFLLHCATQEFVSMPLKISSYPRYQNFYKTVCFLVKTFLTKKHLLFWKRNLNLNLKPKISAGQCPPFTKALQEQSSYQRPPIEKPEKIWKIQFD